MVLAVDAASLIQKIFIKPYHTLFSFIMKCETLVNNILDANHHIRFAAVFDMSGNLRASKERSGITKMLSPDETKNWATMAVNSWKNRESLYPLIGEGKYVLAVYQNLKRITIGWKKSSNLCYL